MRAAERDRAGGMSVARILAAIGWSILLANVLAAESVTCRMLTGDRAQTYTYRIEKAGAGYTIRIEQDGEAREVAMDAAGAASRFDYGDPANGTGYSARRSGNTITIQGRLKNRAIDREVPVTDAPWFQSLEISLSFFAASGNEKTRFWFINADEGEILQMEASRQGIGQVLRPGSKATSALRVKVTLTGVAALFWRGDYWFRTGDHRFLRYEAKAGAGGPRIVIERMEEREKAP